MNAKPAQFIGGWTAARPDETIPYTVTRTERTVKADAYEFRAQTQYSARPVWFPTKGEAQAWIDGKPTTTQAPALAAVVWAKPNERGDRDGELQAIQLFIDEYDLAPEWRRQ